MRLEIDTKHDSKEEIQSAIDILKRAIGMENKEVMGNFSQSDNKVKQHNCGYVNLFALNEERRLDTQSDKDENKNAYWNENINMHENENKDTYRGENKDSYGNENKNMAWHQDKNAQWDENKEEKKDEFVKDEQASNPFAGFFSGNDSEQKEEDENKNIGNDINSSEDDEDDDSFSKAFSGEDKDEPKITFY
jgi:hypothetical protein